MLINLMLKEAVGLYIPNYIPYQFFPFIENPKSEAIVGCVVKITNCWKINIFLYKNKSVFYLLNQFNYHKKYSFTRWKFWVRIHGEKRSSKRQRPKLWTRSVESLKWRKGRLMIFFPPNPNNNNIKWPFEYIS